MTDCKSKITVDGNAMIRAIDDAQAVLDIMGIDLATVRATDEYDCEWHCGVEDVWWAITAKRLDLTDEYAVRWTVTDEAGIDDVEMYERVDDTDDQQALTEYLHEIAANLAPDGQVRPA